MVLDEGLAIGEDGVVGCVGSAVGLGEGFGGVDGFHFFDFGGDFCGIGDRCGAFSVPDCHARDGGWVLWWVGEENTRVRRAGSRPVYTELCQEEEVHVVWKFIAVWVEEAAEEAFVFESGGEDFAGWEEILVGSIADGHFCFSCVQYLSSAQKFLCMSCYISSLLDAG